MEERQGLHWQIFEISYWGNTNQIVIPHRDRHQNLIGIRGRYLDEEDVENIGKYVPLNIEGKFLSHKLSHNLYGIHINQNKIKACRKCLLLESEKGVMQKSNPGHLISTTACLGGELGKSLLAGENYMDFLLWNQQLFGKDFYLEMQPGLSEEQIKLNQEIIKLKHQLGIKATVACDVHYLKQEDREIHAAYLNSRDDEERELGDFYESTWMMTNEQIHQRMDDQIGYKEVEEALKCSLEIGEKVEEYDLYCPTIVPGADIPDFELSDFFGNYYDRYEYISKFAHSDNVYDRYLLKLIEDGYYEKIPYTTFGKTKFLETLDRIEVELKEMWLVTEKLGTSISSYYISTLELVNIMWEEGDSLVGVARGSVTGMFTMYLIGITQMNPLQWGLPHWRHISHEKVELSDVDIDTQQDRRLKIIEAVKRRRGERKVLNCSTFKTEGSKSAIITAGRGLGLDSDITQYLSNLIPVTRGQTWSLHDCLYGNEEKERQRQTEFANEVKKYDKLLETAMTIEGLICGRSIHASAVYLFNEDFLAHNARMKAPNGIYITQFNMKDSDYCSGLKMDFLTIQALDKIRTCMNLLIDAGYMKWQGSLRATYNVGQFDGIKDEVDYVIPNKGYAWSPLSMAYLIKGRI